jgi:hypothetical protein
MAALRLLIAYAPSNIPRLDQVRLAGAPVGVAAAVSTLTCCSSVSCPHS